MNGTKTIHIIENNPSIADVLRIALEDVGYSVFAVDNMDEARTKAQIQPPDLVLLDLDMNIQYGIEYVNWLKNVRRARIPMVLMGYDDETRRLARSLGADGWLHMPFNIDDLIELVNRLITQGDDER
ncbi:MAG: response regulator [Chloroflexota bacterium]